MSGSSESVNYAIRPCKSVERKMMCEMISRLSAFCDLNEYRYIGMGAKYFVDFILFHKEFGINKMFSLEISSDMKSKERFQFNKPYDFIKMMHGDSHDILNSTTFPWKNEKDIIWLDYDGGIKGKQLSDVEICCGKVQSGSVIFISSNVEFGEGFKQLPPEQKVDVFCERIDNERLTKLVEPIDLAGKNIYKTVKNLFNMVIENKLLERNSIIEDSRQHLNYKQIAFFKYADSDAVMMTLGWIIYSNEDEAKFENCNFDNLSFFSDNDEFYDISVPNLTYKEVSLLNKYMPNPQYPLEGASFFKQKEVDGYKKIYRYYPTTFEVQGFL